MKTAAIPMSAGRRGKTLALLALALSLASCSLFKTEGSAETPSTSSTPSTPGDEGTVAKVITPSTRPITAQTPAVRAYRKTGARHIYKVYAQRIYKGKIPPLVHAVVVVETEIDAQGNVLSVDFSRVPSHAPDVPPAIATLIKAASPLPSPGKLGGHTYVETWLWDKSGKFQLDSLTLGQRSR